MSKPLKHYVIEGIIELAERRLIPDSWIRSGIRELCRRRLLSTTADPERAAQITEDFLAAARLGPIACVPEKANAQHYEVPAGFFELMLGPAKKYSSCYWDDGTDSLAQAELSALTKTCQNAELGPDQRILELGCGWGSLTLHMASTFPSSTIVAVSNSHSQRQYIQTVAQQRGLANVTVITADINDFEPPGTFDRVVSVEMFEHLRNHALLLKTMSRWVRPQGKLLVHIFCTKDLPYTYVDQGPDDWMARHFFSGGMMPSDDLLLRYQQHWTLERQWRWSGKHYQKTLEAWLCQLDGSSQEAALLLQRAGEPQPQRALQRWRLFLLACSELFGFHQGRQWWVSHYRFQVNPGTFPSLE